MTEHDQQAALFAYLRRRYTTYPVLRCIFAIPNGGHRHVAAAKRMKAEGVMAGVWDIFVAVPTDGYGGMFIEMKVKPNRLTKSQQSFRERVGDGYAWAVCYDWPEAVRAIGEYLGIEEMEQLS